MKSKTDRHDLVYGDVFCIPGQRYRWIVLKDGWAITDPTSTHPDIRIMRIAHKIGVVYVIDRLYEPTLDECFEYLLSKRPIGWYIRRPGDPNPQRIAWSIAKKLREIDGVDSSASGYELYVDIGDIRRVYRIKDILETGALDWERAMIEELTNKKSPEGGS